MKLIESIKKWWLTNDTGKNTLFDLNFDQIGTQQEYVPGILN